ncbi:MAG: hypothetical protein ABIF01_04050 [Candidatus Micrarchaeota archaeon]
MLVARTENGTNHISGLTVTGRMVRQVPRGEGIFGTFDSAKKMAMSAVAENLANNRLDREYSGAMRLVSGLKGRDGNLSFQD